MTLAQFKRMKPKYQLRLILTSVVAFALAIGLLMGISYGFSAIRRRLNTSAISGVTAETVLLQSSMNKIQETIGQKDIDRLLVMDSRLVCTAEGVPIELSMQLVSLNGTSGADFWQLTSNAKKTVLQKTRSESQNRASLDLRKLTFRDYYPALSRSGTLQLVQHLQNTFPVGEGGRYIFTDQFDDNLRPQHRPYLEQGYQGLWISKIGALSAFTESYSPVSFSAPMVVSVQVEDPKKSKPKKTVLLPSEEVAVVLLEAGPYLS